MLLPAYIDRGEIPKKRAKINPTKRNMKRKCVNALILSHAK
jgi:hypothetical protein